MVETGSIGCLNVISDLISCNLSYFSLIIGYHVIGLVGNDVCVEMTMAIGCYTYC